MPLIYRYMVKVSVFDDAGNVVKVYSQNFRLRAQAEEFKSALRTEHDRAGTISLIEIVELDTNSVVDSSKSKHLQKKLRDAKKRR